MELKDLKIGDTVYCRITGNAARGRKKEELIEEWEIIKIGIKYITAKPKKNGEYLEFQFEINNNYKQRTKYCIDYVLYVSMQDILNENELIDLNNWFRSKFVAFGGSEFSLESLRNAKNILESNGVINV